MRTTANIPLYKVSLIIMKNGLCKKIVNNPKVTMMTATISGNQAIPPLSINPSASAIRVRATKIVVARINVVNSEATKKPMIGPNSMNRLRKIFLSIIMEYFCETLYHETPLY